MTFKFNFDAQIQPKVPEKESKIPGKKLVFETETVEQTVTGSVVRTGSGLLFKRTVPDIYYEIAQNDGMEATHELVEAMTASSDLIEGVYEGGCKTWECATDLVSYLENIASEITDKQIIELGCGSALPGIKAIQLGAANVDFQDFNENVINFVTIPNIVLNTANIPIEVDNDGFFDSAFSYKPDGFPFQFFSGDWGNLTVIITNKSIIDKKYDIILSSETIYNSDTIPRLLKLIQSCLSQSGYALIAAKHTYFGCSGSLQEFKNAALNCGFLIESVFSHTIGIRREILKLKFGSE